VLNKVNSRAESERMYDENQNLVQKAIRDNEARVKRISEETERHQAGVSAIKLLEEGECSPPQNFCFMSSNCVIDVF
jgi:hypothetical protein